LIKRSTRKRETHDTRKYDEKEQCFVVFGMDCALHSPHLSSLKNLQNISSNKKYSNQRLFSLVSTRAEHKSPYINMYSQG
jgi:hypothetical protein